MQGALSREQSIRVQGIAILLMIWHHFFLEPSVYGDGFFVFPDAAFRFAWFARITVSLYSFVSGYGMFFVMKRASQRFRASLSRALAMYLRHWTGFFLLIVLPDLLVFKNEPLNAARVIGNLTAANPDLNGAMWYVLQYLIHMLLAPVLWYLMTEDRQQRNRTRIICAIFCVLLASCALFVPACRPFLALLRDYTHPTLLLVFPAGFCCASYRLYERFAARIPSGSGSGALISLLLCGAACAVRLSLPENTSNTRFDCLIVPVFVYGITGVTERLPRFVRNVLTWLGKHSVWMWIAHIPVLGATFFLCFFIRKALPFYLAELLIIIPIAVLFTKLEAFVKARVSRRDPTAQA